jgi:hypothetical protein
VNFSNVALGWVPEDWQAQAGHWRVFEQGAVHEGPDICVFWEASEEDWTAYQRLTSDGQPGLEARVRQLHATPGRVCSEYAAPWVTGGRRTLCYRCD